MCGIWAMSSANKKGWNSLTRWKFQTLGVEMDSRGGDGCGIAFDNMVHKSEDVPKFDEFWRNEWVPKNLDYPVIIGHDRKASVGGKTFENTQPICFVDNKSPICSIVAHNGTLYNHKELYKKHKAEAHYELDTTLMSDSQMLTLLIDRVGWGILGEYTGSVAMLYMNTKEPGIMYAYHGRSSTRKGYVEMEERPLYYARDEESIWFCSTRSALEKIIADKGNIFELPFNKVFRITGNQMSSIFEVDRSESFQNEPYVYSAGTKWNEQLKIWEDESHTNNRTGGYDALGNWKSNKHDDKRVITTGFSALNREDTLSKINTTEGFGVDMWRWISGRACINGKPIHGLATFSRSGKLFNNRDTKEFTTLLSFYFWQGNMVRGRLQWMEIMKLKRDKLDTKLMSAKEFLLTIAEHFVMPFFVPKDIGGNNEFLFDTIVNPKTGLCDVPYYGTVRPIFTSKQLQIKAGLVISHIYTSQYATIEMFEHHTETFPDMYLEWEKEFNKKVKEALPVITVEPKDIEEDPTIAECPECRDDFHNSKLNPCETCFGTDRVSMKYIKEQVNSIGDAADFMTVLCEEAKITIALCEMVDEGINTLEEHDMRQKSTHVYDKLKTIKKLLADGKYSSDV